MVLNVQREERRRLRLARMAVDIFFFLNGVMTATFSTRLPAVQMRLALPPGQLGLALLGCTIGGLLAMNIVGRVSSRFEGKVITTLAAFGMCLTLPLVAFAPTLPLFLLALVFFGAGSGAMDVSMNLQGTAVERVYGRSIMNSFHAYFSLGSLAGASLGSILAAFDVKPEPHFFAITVVGCVVLMWSSRFLCSSKQEQMVQKQPAKTALSFHISPTLMRLGVIAFCSLLSVGALFDWSAVYLSGTLHTSTGLAATGFTTFLLCMAIGRSVGDFLATRFGATAIMRMACLLAAIGLVLALLFAWTPVVFFGLGLVGIGLSVPFPLVLSAAGRLAKRDRGATLATVTTWGYCGMIAGPPVIGFLAEQVGMRLALAPVGFLCVLAAFCAPAVRTVVVKEDEGRM
ncbi:MFS transporter [Dictyobacter arantiisoli]|uniref:MFS transporter n=1 Tax=Dictyobacter arantiisoli TaxID=2014874 RepID=A0A5A5TKA9_9CHLR|nr:MFS transporter [Dictyobacter arantiisoli]GCF11668.1 MFS transporter [Dictyobacter arantiisoli]